MRDVLRESGDYRALKFDIARRDIADVVVELQTRSCSVVGSEGALREWLLRKPLRQIPSLIDKVPWYAVDEARIEDQMLHATALMQLAEPQQSDASGAPASAAIEAPAPPATEQAGAHSSSPSSEAMDGLNHGPLRSAEVQQDVNYENVYEDEDGMRMSVEEAHANGMNVNNELRVGNLNGVNDNANNNELRVRNVGDLNELHVVNGLGTNDDFLNVNEHDRVHDNLNGMPVSTASVRVSAASAPSVQIGRSERRMRYERIVTTLAVVHAASQSTGGPVNRGLSPLEPEPVVPRAGSVPATMTAVTSCTTTTTTALLYTTRERDDFLRMSTTAQARLIVRDPRAASAAHVDCAFI